MALKHLSFLGKGYETSNGTKPIARQQIFNNATAGLQQWNNCVFYMVHAERLSGR
jgi:hypothetical protein